MTEQDNNAVITKSPRSTRKHVMLVAAMVAAFLVVVLYRDAIRVRWWANRLAGSDDPKERIHYAELLASRRERSMPGLRRLLTSDDAGNRSLAVMVLNTLQGDDSLELLTTAARDADPVIRRNAIIGISMRDANAATTALGGLVDHPDEASAMLAVSRLAGLRTERATEALARLAVEHASVGVRAQAIESLEVRGGDGAVVALTACLKDKAVFSGLTESERGALEAVGAATTQGADASPAALGFGPMTNAERAARALRRLDAD